MKEEIEIPPQLAEIIKDVAKKQGFSADEFMEAVIRKFFERSKTDAE